MKKTEAAARYEDWTDRARQMMTLQGLTYDDVAEVLGVKTRGSVSHYLLRQRELSALQAVALAKRLDCSLEWLLSGTLPDSDPRTRAASATLPSAEAICELIKRLPPDLYASVANVLTALTHRVQPHKRSKQTSARKRR